VPASLWALNLVAPLGVEPSTNGFRFVMVSHLPGLCLHRNSFRRLRWVPSSLYTFQRISA